MDLTEVEDLDDVGVVERERDLGFVHEHAGELGLVRKVLSDLLDHDPLGQPLRDPDRRQVHLRHAPLADELGKDVAPEDLGKGRGHATTSGPR